MGYLKMDKGHESDWLKEQWDPSSASLGLGSNLSPYLLPWASPRPHHLHSPLIWENVALHQQTWVGLQLKPKPIKKSKPKSSKLPHSPPLQLASSAPPAAFLVATFKPFLFTLPGRPPPKGLVREKSPRFLESILTKNEGFGWWQEWEDGEWEMPASMGKTGMKRRWRDGGGLAHGARVVIQMGRPWARLKVKRDMDMMGVGNDEIQV